MMDDLRQLYQEVILDHGRNPRNRRQPDGANRQALGKNPACGDALVVYLRLDAGGRVEDVGFKGQGCAISMASASLMTEILRGKAEAEVARLFDAFHALATGEGEVDIQDVDPDDLDRLQSLAGVRQFPVRVKCATLAWHTMKAALGGQAVATTE